MSFQVHTDYQQDFQQFDYQYISYEEIQDVADYHEIKIETKIKKRVKKTKLEKMKRQAQHRKQSTNIKPQCLNLSPLQSQENGQEALQELTSQFGQMNLAGVHHQTNQYLNYQNRQNSISEIIHSINNMSLN